jgi:uncharacterized protein (TIGR02421 family)
MNQIKEIDSKLLKVSKKVEEFTLDLINPINSQKEKELFFSNYSKYGQYNPNFTYLNKQNFENEKAELNILKKELKNSLAEKIMSKRVISLENEINLLYFVNTKKFCNNSKKVYGEPNKKEVKMAQEIIQSKINFEEKKISSEQMLNEIQKHLIGTGFEGELKTNMSAKAAVNLSKKKLFIKNDAFFGSNDAKRFIVHEIETHIFRHLNGSIQPIKILSAGSGEDYLKTEEGLAVLNEELFKSNSKEQEKIIAARLYAVNYALTHDFFDTFDEMKKYFSDDEAYQLAQRVKRGVIRNEKGAFTKDYCYYSGLLLLKNYFNKGQPLTELYLGKISLNETKIVTKIKEIQKPKFIPNYNSL